MMDYWQNPSDREEHEYSFYLEVVTPLEIDEQKLIDTIRNSVGCFSEVFGDVEEDDYHRTFTIEVSSSVDVDGYYDKWDAITCDTNELIMQIKLLSIVVDANEC